MAKSRRSGFLRKPAWIPAALKPWRLSRCRPARRADEDQTNRYQTREAPNDGICFAYQFSQPASHMNASSTGTAMRGSLVARPGQRPRSRIESPGPAAPCRGCRLQRSPQACAVLLWARPIWQALLPATEDAFGIWLASSTRTKGRPFVNSIAPNHHIERQPCAGTPASGIQMVERDRAEGARRREHNVVRQSWPICSISGVWRCLHTP